MPIYSKIMIGYTGTSLDTVSTTHTERHTYRKTHIQKDTHTQTVVESVALVV